jgi:hypothetical protein
MLSELQHMNVMLTNSPASLPQRLKATQEKFALMKSLKVEKLFALSSFLDAPTSMKEKVWSQWCMEFALP